MRTAMVGAARRAMGAAGGLLVVVGALVPVSHVMAATGDELFISEYVEGTGTNQAIEIFNPTDTPMSLSASGYRLRVLRDRSPAGPRRRPPSRSHYTRGHLV